jgi:hypothetical protein
VSYHFLSVHRACFGVCFVSSWFKRPPRVLEYAVGYAWRDTNGFDLCKESYKNEGRLARIVGTNYYFLLIYVSFTTTMTIE